MKSLDFLKYKHPDQNDYSELPKKVDAIKAELAGLRNLFQSLVKKLSECERQFCSAPGDDPSAISTCPMPAAHEAISVGPNNDVGSSANFKEKAKKKAAGLATKAITGLLGIGGGGGGGKSEGPATYKDPVKNKQKIKVRTIFVPGVQTFEN